MFKSSDDHAYKIHLCCKMDDVFLDQKVIISYT